MDAGHHAERHQRITQQGAAQRAVAQGHGNAGQTRLQQGTTGIVVIDAGQVAFALPCVILAAQKAEAVTALDLAKGRNMKDLVGAQLAAISNRCAMIEQVQMTFAKGIAHIAQHGAQGAIGTVAKPETDGIEYITEYARHGLQPDFAIGIAHALLMQQAIYPVQQGRYTIAMVAIAKRQHIGAVARNQPRTEILFPHAAQGQAQVIDAITKEMPARPQARMAYLPQAQLRLRLGGQRRITRHGPAPTPPGSPGWQPRPGPISNHLHGSRNRSRRPRTRCFAYPGSWPAAFVPQSLRHRTPDAHRKIQRSPWLDRVRRAGSRTPWRAY